MSYLRNVIHEHIEVVRCLLVKTVLRA